MKKKRHEKHYAGKKNTTKLLLILVAVAIAVIFIVNKNRYAIEGSIGEDTPEAAAYFSSLRQKMVEEHLRSRDITDEAVLEVMGKVERHRFVPSDLRDDAYEDHPLPIGYGQTISQPYIVAFMTQGLEVDKGDKVLEIGTGSGYQAAVLAELVKKVYTIEIIEELAASAEQRLQGLGYDAVEVKHADGYFGWEKHAPFGAIIVTAAANHIPPPLLRQLRDGGKLIIPLGDTRTFQTLTIVTKNGDELDTEFITGVRFVPLTGEAQKR